MELGSSYGNTTLAYKCGYKWDDACKAWLDMAKPLDKFVDVHVNAVDLSNEALAYGKERGIFDETMQHDFSQPYTPEIAAKLQEADFVTSIMTTFYIPTERWMEGCYKFLSDRSKPKLLVYNVMQSFDQRNLTPELLFAGISNWTAQSSFNKHRNFTEIEQASHHGTRRALPCDALSAMQRWQAVGAALRSHAKRRILSVLLTAQAAGARGRV